MMEIIVLVLFVIKEKKHRIHWAGKVVFDMAVYFAVVVLLEYYTAQTVIAAVIIGIIAASLYLFNLTEKSENRKDKSQQKVVC